MTTNHAIVVADIEMLSELAVVGREFSAVERHFGPTPDIEAARRYQQRVLLDVVRQLLRMLLFTPDLETVH
jgi:hypothetical protein